MCVCVCAQARAQLLSHVRSFATPWTVAHQAPPSMEFSRQEYWSGLPFPSPGDLPDPEIEPESPALQADTLPSEPPGKYHCIMYHNLCTHGDTDLENRTVDTVREGECWKEEKSHTKISLYTLLIASLLR